MTNKEAIKLLSMLPMTVLDADFSSSTVAAINMAIEALQERPKGRWIEVYDLDYLKFIWSCDQCGEDAPTKQETCDQILKPFCPNCGAEMER